MSFKVGDIVKYNMDFDGIGVILSVSDNGSSFLVGFVACDTGDLHSGDLHTKLASGDINSEIVETFVDRCWWCFEDELEHNNNTLGGFCYENML